MVAAASAGPGHTATLAAVGRAIHGTLADRPDAQLTGIERLATAYVRTTAV